MTTSYEDVHLISVKSLSRQSDTIPNRGVGYPQAMHFSHLPNPFGWLINSSVLFATHTKKSRLDLYELLIGQIIR